MVNATALDMADDFEAAESLLKAAVMARPENAVKPPAAWAKLPGAAPDMAWSADWAELSWVAPGNYTLAAGAD